MSKINSKNLLTWGIQLLIGILVSLGLYILNDIKSDIKELRRENKVLTETIDSMVDGTVDEIWRLKVELAELKK